MKLELKPGCYVVAVSGGVDSMVLLDVLVRQGIGSLVVAHFDHGIREESAQDRQLVGQVAASHKLPFFYEEGHLGTKKPSANQVSEATARTARYDFLERVKQQVGAQAIITAHHQDDVLETVIINLLRGTGRRGLSSLQSTPELLRPLLGYSKAQLVEYAKQHQLAWHDDATNTDLSYLRNYVRHRLLTRFNQAQTKQWLDLIQHSQKLNHQIDQILDQLIIWSPTNQLPRPWFINLPHVIAREVMATWLRHNQITGYDRHLLERLTTAAKTLSLGKQIDVHRGYVILVGNDCLLLKRIDS